MNHEFYIRPEWRERGVAFLVAHPDDESLMFGALQCLC